MSAAAAAAAAAAAGRRPGNVDTKGEIVEAAKRVFAAKGYDGASLRAVVGKQVGDDVTVVLEERLDRLDD